MQLRGIEYLTVRDLRRLGNSNPNHLYRATTMEIVLCTNDTDYIALAVAGQQRAGIVIGQQEAHHIGAWVRQLELMHTVLATGYAKTTSSTSNPLAICPRHNSHEHC